MEAMVRFAGRCGTSPGRGAYAEARACQEMIATCRQRLARLIQAEGPDRIVFAMNCSEALAIVIRGLLATAPWSVEQSRRVGAVPNCAATSLARAGGYPLRSKTRLGERVNSDPPRMPRCRVRSRVFRAVGAQTHRAKA